MEDRREFERKSIRFKVVCVPSENPNRRVNAEGVNISIGGLGLKLKEPFRTGSDVVLRIARPFFQDSIEAKGKVAWQSGPDKAGEITAGVKFLEIPWSKIKSLLC